MRFENFVEGYVFLVKTDKYAGNFCREMCAYLTGEIGECNVGNNFASLYREEEDVEFEDDIAHVVDDHSTLRPCSMEGEEGSTFGSWSDVAIYFNKLPNADQVRVMKGRAFIFSKGVGSKRAAEEFSGDWKSVDNDYQASGGITIKGFEILKITRQIEKVECSDWGSHYE